MMIDVREVFNTSITSNSHNFLVQHTKRKLACHRGVGLTTMRLIWPQSPHDKVCLVYNYILILIE